MASDNTNTDQTSPPQDFPTFRTKACKFFAKGPNQCLKGDQCMFSHAVADIAAFQASQPKPMPFGWPSNDVVAAAQPKPAPFEWPAKDEMERPRACSYLAQGDYCIHGKRCVYSHDPNVIEAFKASVARRISNRGKFGRGNCRFYARGDCKKGSSCTYSHGEEGVPFLNARAEVGGENQGLVEGGQGSHVTSS